MKKTLIIVTMALLASCGSQSENQVDRYNIIWDSPSKDHNGSMPIGNGSTGLNVWVEENGDLCFYIGRIDSWGDNGRLLKVGKVRVKCDPPIVHPGADFRQELDLKTGTIRIRSKGKKAGKNNEINLIVWVDAHNPVINISQESKEPVQMKATIELWRKIQIQNKKVQMRKRKREKMREGEERNYFRGMDNF